MNCDSRLRFKPSGSFKALHPDSRVFKCLPREVNARIVFFLPFYDATSCLASVSSDANRFIRDLSGFQDYRISSDPGALLCYSTQSDGSIDDSLENTMQLRNILGMLSEVSPRGVWQETKRSVLHGECDRLFSEKSFLSSSHVPTSSFESRFSSCYDFFNSRAQYTTDVYFTDDGINFCLNGDWEMGFYKLYGFVGYLLELQEAIRFYCRCAFLGFGSSQSLEFYHSTPFKLYDYIRTAHKQFAVISDTCLPLHHMLPLSDYIKKYMEYRHIHRMRILGDEHAALTSNAQKCHVREEDLMRMMPDQSRSLGMYEEQTGETLRCSGKVVYIMHNLPFAYQDNFHKLKFLYNYLWQVGSCRFWKHGRIQQSVAHTMRAMNLSKWRTVRCLIPFKKPMLDAKNVLHQDLIRLYIEHGCSSRERKAPMVKGIGVFVYISADIHDETNEGFKYFLRTIRSRNKYERQDIVESILLSAMRKHTDIHSRQLIFKPPICDLMLDELFSIADGDTLDQKRTCVYNSLLSRCINKHVSHRSAPYKRILNLEQFIPSKTVRQWARSRGLARLAHERSLMQVLREDEGSSAVLDFIVQWKERLLGKGGGRITHIDFNHLLDMDIIKSNQITHLFTDNHEYRHPPYYNIMYRLNKKLWSIDCRLFLLT